MASPNVCKISLVAYFLSPNIGRLSNGFRTWVFFLVISSASVRLAFTVQPHQAALIHLLPISANDSPLNDRTVQGFCGQGWLAGMVESRVDQKEATEQSAQVRPAAHRP